MPLKLTERDREALDHLAGWQLESGAPMTTRRLAQLMGTTQQTARNRILILADKGCLEMDDKSRRFFHRLGNVKRDARGLFILTERGRSLNRR